MWPAAITIDAEGNVYISDEALHRISIFDRRGASLASGHQGKWCGHVRPSAGLAFDQDQHLLVVDGLNNRVQPTPKTAAFWGSGYRRTRSRELNLPWGIAVDRAGAVYPASNCWNRSCRSATYTAPARSTAIPREVQFPGPRPPVPHCPRKRRLWCSAEHGCETVNTSRCWSCRSEASRTVEHAHTTSPDAPLAKEAPLRVEDGNTCRLHRRCRHSLQRRW